MISAQIDILSSNELVTEQASMLFKNDWGEHSQGSQPNTDDGVFLMGMIVFSWINTTN